MDWVAVGLCIDVPAGTVVPRQVRDTDLAVWCSANGKYHAWGDRCPHRGMRLSHGFVRGERLACIYHGWQYGADGGCEYIPAHPDLKPPKAICAEERICESDGTLVWVAVKDTRKGVPDIGDRRPIRSIDIQLPAEVVAEHLGQSFSSLLLLGGEFDLAVALQPVSSTSCLIHALAAPDHDRKNVSRHLERMRSSLEATA